MEIVCERCGAGYNIEAPPAASGPRAKNFKFRCGRCGHSFLVNHQSQAAPAPAAPLLSAMLLNQDGQVYQIADLATLQRWIVERRVARTDMVSISNGPWEVLGQRLDLEPFFQVVDQAETSQRPSPPVSPLAPPVWAAQPPRSGPALAPFQEAEDEPTEEMAQPHKVSQWDPDLPTEEAPTESLSPGSVGPALDPEPTSEAPSPLFAGAPSISPREPEQPVRTGVSLGSDAPEEEDDFPPPRTESTSLAWGLVGAALVAAVAAGSYLYVWKPDEAPQAAALAASAAPAPRTPPEALEPAPAPAAAPAGAPAAAPAGAAAAPASAGRAPAPAPSPAAAPAPAPARSPAPAPSPADRLAPPAPAPKAGAKALVKKGWSAVEAGDLSGAEGYFRQAVDASPSSAAALYGHGYVLGKLGDSAGARSQLCRALELSGSNIDMQREIEGSLRNIGASCG